MRPPLVLVVEADAGVSAAVSRELERKGLRSLWVSTEFEALEILRTEPVWLLMRGSVGKEASTDFLSRAERLRPAVVCMDMRPESQSPERAEALRHGVFDIVDRPPTASHLEWAVERARVQHELLAEHHRLREELQGRAGYQRLIGRSEAMERVRERVARLAAGEIRVLFTGEPGAGKRLAARTLHALSPRRDRLFVEADCGTQNPTAVEAELFGQERGVPMGADRRVVGLLESTDGGVLLLNEVGALSLGLQERLVRVLAEGAFTRVGGSERIPLDVRLLSTTSHDIERAVSETRFREDLFRALAPTTVALPPLRERPEDVALLVSHFIEVIRQINNLPPVQVSPEALALLERYRWVGNVRELRNAVEQAVILAVEGTINPRHLPESIRRDLERIEGADPSGLRFRDAKRQVVDAFERSYLEGLMERHRGNVTAAAAQAGMLRSALQRLLRKHDLRSSRFRGEPLRSLDQ
jgi:DNA-binding NtrC family response regulator